MATGEEGTADRKRCEGMLETGLNRCGKVKFMIEHIEKLGCVLPPDMFTCRPCGEAQASGGWVFDNKVEGEFKPQVVLCEDKPLTQTMVNHTLAHELIHAFDQCRNKVNWNNCLHHACSEIRAANTSGECGYWQEFLRGHPEWGGQQQVRLTALWPEETQSKVCVKRRAELSLKGNPACAHKAREYVQAAFKSCYYDTEPYDKNPW